MKSRTSFLLLLLFAACIALSQADLRYGFENDESNDDYPVLRKRATTKPSWTPSFPGAGNYLGNDADYEEPESESEYISTYKPPATSKRSSWAPAPTTTTTTTTERYQWTTTEEAAKKLPWYKRFRNYAKDKYNYVYNKLG